MSNVLPGAMLVLLFAAPLHAQATRLTGRDCGLEKEVACRRVLVTEPTWAIRAASWGDEAAAEYNSDLNFMASFGVVAPVARRIGIGALATVGLGSDDGPYLGAGPRLRWHAGSRVAVDLTPTLLLLRPQEQGWGLLDAAVMYRDRVGLAFQVSPFDREVYDYSDPENTTVTNSRSTALFAGLRLGMKPGRIGLVADAVLTVAAVVYAVVTCAGGGCS